MTEVIGHVKRDRDVYSRTSSLSFSMSSIDKSFYYSIFMALFSFILKYRHYGYCLSLCTNKVPFFTVRSVPIKCHFLLSEEHNFTDLAYLVFFDTTICFGCPHQLSSCGTRKEYKRRVLSLEAVRV